MWEGKGNRREGERESKRKEKEERREGSFHPWLPLAPFLPVNVQTQQF